MMGYVKKNLFAEEKRLIHSIPKFILELLEDNKSCPHKWPQAAQLSLLLPHFHFLTFLKYLSGGKR